MASPGGTGGPGPRPKEYALNPYCPACARDLVDCLSEKMFAGSKCKAEMEVEADE